ncbi:GtrA family protein [Pseudomonas sp. FSL R10-2245]|uniref:GtrA family protein n=1 Tax=Pseudomonas sp. FSL R10-2245 TaxID=2662200 RepID=UPI00129611C9|nr:GtrA family protein [Pseudomonas sp. FSL R10-2245]MQU00181.1 GtrA family protein [Pseudomonas sp. FSL R10-2245]
MNRLFIKYLSVGVLNTLLHWVVFAWLVYREEYDQATANLYAFSVAVTFSFFANAYMTFQKKPTTVRYIGFVAFMGALSYALGCFADRINLPPILTLGTFSATSLVVGFFYSKLIIFKDIKK